MVNEGRPDRDLEPVPLRSMKFGRSIGVDVVGCSGARARQPLEPLLDGAVVVLSGMEASPVR